MMRAVSITAMRKSRRTMHLIGRALFWWSSALFNCPSPSLVCSTTCSMLKSMRSSMVPWSITNTANSLKICDSSSMLSAIRVISSSRSAATCSKSSTTSSCCCVNPTLICWVETPRCCPGRLRNSSSEPPLEPVRCDLSFDMYSFCSERNREDFSCSFLASATWMFRRTLSSDSAPPPATTCFSCLSDFFSSKVTARLSSSIFLSWACSLSSNVTMSLLF
mmetsp:Transcript_34623/g.78261  ORF Transcript_34623/g.78261 Transcript_34623/m.78261 type:complete len:220 (+) Transcript_34623:508-1167(+)